MKRKNALTMLAVLAAGIGGGIGAGVATAKPAAPPAAHPAHHESPAAPVTVGPALSLLAPVLNVADPERVIAFYRDGLGMSLAMTMPGNTGTEYMMRFGSDPSQPGIILQTVAGVTAPLTAGTAFNRLVLRVSDIDALAARLQRAGYAPGPIRDVAHGYRMMMVTDPESHRLELVQSGNRPQE